MMTSKLNLMARPYAVAAFEYAVACNKVAAWAMMLNTASLVAQDPLVKRWLMHPQVTSEQLGKLFCDVLAMQLDAEQKNFILLLAENRRLSLLPDIAQLFKSYQEAQEKMLTVTVRSAVELSQDYQKKLIAALTKRLERRIVLITEVDPEVIGGAVISTGDLVIDGSVRGKLNRLNEFISGIS